MIKRIKHLTLACFTLVGLSACAELNQVLNSGGEVGQHSAHSPVQLQRGVKEALQLSATRASDLLGQAGGYSNSSDYRITLPEAVQSVTDPLRRMGLGGQIDQVESLMNRGAELAANEAKTVFLQAVRDMSISDAMGIVRGADTAATDYFKAQTESQLRERYRPIMQAQLEQLGFYNQYQQLLNAYKLVPMNDKPNLDLEERAVTQGVNALFQQIGEEESKIRANPMEQGSALLAAILSNR